MRPKEFKLTHGDMMLLQGLISSLPDSGTKLALIPFKSNTQWHFKCLLGLTDITEAVGTLLGSPVVGEWGNRGIPMADTSSLSARCFDLTQAFRQWSKRVTVCSVL